MLRNFDLHEIWSSMRLVAIGLGLAFVGLLAAALGVFLFGSGHLVAAGLAMTLLATALLTVYVLFAK